MMDGLCFTSRYTSAGQRTEPVPNPFSLPYALVKSQSASALNAVQQFTWNLALAYSQERIYSVLRYGRCDNRLVLSATIVFKLLCGFTP